MYFIRGSALSSVGGSADTQVVEQTTNGLLRCLIPRLADGQNAHGDLFMLVAIT
jgi:hypothetical protein